MPNTRRDSFTSSMDINSQSIDVRTLIKTGRETARARWITIEPIMCLGAMSNAALIATRLQYIRERIAHDSFNQSSNYDANETNTCYAPSDNSTDDVIQIEIQARLSMYSLILNALSTFPAIFTTILIGSLSDRIGRRIGLVTPLVGLVIQAALYVALFYAHLPLWVCFIADTLQGITGGSGLVLGTAVAYLADITDEEHRTWRIVVAESAFVFGSGVIQPINGLVIQHYGMGVAFLISLGVVLPGLVYAALPWCMPETMEDEVKETFAEYMKDMFQGIQKLLTDNLGGRRWRILTLCLAGLFLGTCIYGLMITVTYGLGPPFCWSPDIVGYYNAASYIMSVAGVMVAVKVLSHCLSDMWVVHCGTLSLACAYIFTALAPTTVFIFLALIPGSVGGMVSPVLKGTLSKIVSEHEQGSMFALVGCIDNIAQFVGPVTSNAIYASTVSIYESIVFYVFAGLLIFPTVLIGIVQVFGTNRRGGYIPIPHYDSLPN